MKQYASELADQLQRTCSLLSQARSAVARQVIGQQNVIDLALIALLCDGHALLVGVPGLAKTRLVRTMGRVMGLDTNRVQFTPDLMPSDILGSEVLEEHEGGKRHFRFIEGPVFCQLLMADEINRASPRTQSALLQAMQEKQVTIAGRERSLPVPFHVLATQNPIEQEGTYPLPEAQLDRFLFQIDVGYPQRDAEREILKMTTGTEEPEVEKVFSAEDLLAAQKVVRQMPVGEGVVEAILDLVRWARPDSQDAPDFISDNLNWGPGPRATQALMLATRARALIDGRLAPSVEDVAALAKPVLNHRIALSFAARANGQLEMDLIDQLVALRFERTKVA